MEENVSFTNSSSRDDLRGNNEDAQLLFALVPSEKIRFSHPLEGEGHWPWGKSSLAGYNGNKRFLASRSRENDYRYGGI